MSARSREAALGEGGAGLARFAIAAVPARCSRCWRSRRTSSPTRSASSAAPALEYKLDGARVQVHKAGDEVRVYTRGLNEVTGAVPELVEAVRGAAGAKS